MSVGSLVAPWTMVRLTSGKLASKPKALARAHVSQELPPRREVAVVSVRFSA